MKIDLSGRVALITGSTAGIGEATAQALADAWAHVVINGRDAGHVQDVARRHGGQGITADVGTAAGAATVIGQLPDADILVNNIGITITNGQGATILMTGPSITMNEGALVVT